MVRGLSLVFALSLVSCGERTCDDPVTYAQWDCAGGFHFSLDIGAPLEGEAWTIRGENDGRPFELSCDAFDSCQLDEEWLIVDVDSNDLVVQAFGAGTDFDNREQRLPTRFEIEVSAPDGGHVARVFEFDPDPDAECPVCESDDRRLGVDDLEYD